MNSSFVMILVCILIVGVTFWQNSPASSSELESLVSRVNQSSSEEVKSKLVLFLKEIPNPSRQELSAFEAEVDQILVIDLSRKTTGDNTLVAKEPEISEPPKKQTFIERLVIWFFSLFIGTYAIWSLYRVFRRKKEDQL
ncbi:hypothetical protein D0C16_08465 [Cellvibrio sp. KY-GH-1]|uniref:hypothetical protein n=1 Tax=Cellvibrio sp. KY-GH-1 TaxID=2303332 RepID=UPI001243FE0C|nr:hypothetical protein [Cellvibrio sp. KY-GH-1]QEY16007.1 hypothetical protein D0C16_08465 [Cellvibrio sp. KY-GH-1]